MRSKSLSLLCLPLVLAGGTAAAAPARPVAPPPASPAAHDPFVEAYAAILDSIDVKESLDLSTVAYAQRAIGTDPVLGQIEASRPGLTAYLADALRPPLTQLWLRLYELYRPRVIAAVQETFTPSEAQEITVFCRTRAGRKLMAAANAAYDSKATIASALKAGLISPEEARTSTEETAQHAMSELTQEDTAQIGEMAETSPALQKINLLTQRLGALRLEMENEPPTPQEKIALDAAIRTGVAAHAAPVITLPPPITAPPAPPAPLMGPPAGPSSAP